MVEQNNLLALTTILSGNRRLRHDRQAAARGERGEGMASDSDSIPHIAGIAASRGKKCAMFGCLCGPVPSLTMGEERSVVVRRSGIEAGRDGCMEIGWWVGN